MATMVTMIAKFQRTPLVSSSTLFFLQATQLMASQLSRPQDSPARKHRFSHRPPKPSAISAETCRARNHFCFSGRSYHPPLCMEAVAGGPPFTRHCDWFHLGGCLDAILYAPPAPASGSEAAGAAAGSSSVTEIPPTCTAAWQPFEHPCLRPTPAPTPSLGDIGCPPSSLTLRSIISSHSYSQIVAYPMPRELLVPSLSRASDGCRRYPSDHVAIAARFAWV